jgi:hypothetical protein
VTEIRSYHGQPVIKEPVWSWEIPTYFFAGGMAGSSAGLAYLSQLRGNDVLARRAWTVALFGLSVSPPLLISDLGKPTRFVNMLRMFKITSPMSVGSWILSGAGATTALAAGNAWTGLFPTAARLACPGAALLGLPLSTYTAALLANTAAPAWHEAHRMLPFVFGCGAALSAGSASVALTPPEHARPARRLAVGAAMLDVALKEAMVERLGEHGEPYKTGTAGKFRQLTLVATASGAGLLLARGGTSRAASAVAGALLCAGALSSRWSTFRAGFQSAADPRYVIGPQRGAIERGEREGAARRQPRVSAADRKLGSPASAPVALP